VRLAIASNPAFSDGDLVAQVAAGDLHALGVLFERFGTDVRRFLARLGVPASDLDDLVQTTFIEAVRPAARFDANRPVKPWLFGMAAMVVRRHRRGVARWGRKLAAWALEPTTRHEPTPAEIVDRDQSVRRAQAALARLSDKKREVFVLVVIENQSGEAAARALGIPVATVWTRLHHARLELRAMMADKDDER
jgi:RNA polymerase sigma-70 factor (ECF subfamily)